MLEKFSTTSFKNRDYYRPNCRWAFVPQKDSDPSRVASVAEDLAQRTQLFSLLRYLDVPDPAMQDRCMDYFNGSWTSETAEISWRFGLDRFFVGKANGYRSLGPTWTCPGCRRTKIETVRRAKKTNKHTIRFVWHHDHMLDHMKAFRFRGITVCEECNNVDPALKDSIKWKVRRVDGTPDHGVYPDFSFSPDEIFSIFGRRAANIPFAINASHVEKATHIYESHFVNGVEGFKDDVRTAHRRILAEPVATPEHKIPLLEEFNLSFEVAELADVCIVDGQRTSRTFISEHAEPFVYVLKNADKPIDDDEIEDLKARYVAEQLR